VGDEERRRILQRRAAFVTAAIAMTTAADHCGSSGPKACLDLPNDSGAFTDGPMDGAPDDARQDTSSDAPDEASDASKDASTG
jgi:hypothetical protein